MERTDARLDRGLPPGTADIPEVARRLGIGHTLAYKLAKDGCLPVPVIRLGRRVVVPRSALDRLLTDEPASDAPAT